MSDTETVDQTDQPMTAADGDTIEGDGTGHALPPADEVSTEVSTEDTEPVEGELVTDEPGTDIEVLGTLPDTGEWRTLCVMAATLAESNIVPEALRRKPADVLMIMLTARGLGLDITLAMRECHVIKGKVTLSPKIRLALLNTSGKGAVKPFQCSATSATARVYDRAGTLIDELTLTMEDAPNELKTKDNWKNYPQRMLWWRAAGWAMDDHFPEVGMGIYSPDELGAVTDDQGVPITPTNVLSEFASSAPPQEPPIAPGQAEWLVTTLLRLRPPEGLTDEALIGQFEKLRAVVLDDWKGVASAPNRAGEMVGLPPEKLNRAQGQQLAAMLRRLIGQIDDLHERAGIADAELVEEEEVVVDYSEEEQAPFTDDDPPPTASDEGDGYYG